MKIHIKEWSGSTIAQCAEALADLPYTVFLDSNRPTHPDNNFSILCWHPKKIFKGSDSDIFHTLNNFLSAQSFETPKTHLPFYGGFIGYTSYEYGVKENGVEPQHKSKLPSYILGFYTNGLIFDHKKNQHYVFYTDQDDIDFLKNKIKSITSLQYNTPYCEWQSNNSDNDFKSSITQVIDLINQGEVYQINLTRQFTAPLPDNFNSFAHYKILRDTNPAPFSSFLNFDEFQILSCSPERFIKIDQNNIETKPIKGTLPNTLPADILLHSEKDRAENTMIVDLLRNDLSKVCESHSITVPKLCEIESFSGLHHLVSTVRGRLQEGKTPFDVLKSCFPGGSITGAPKIAAMKHINALENTPRGIYCGSIGYIGLNDIMDMNIVIRTMIVTKDELIINTGSGIVSDSDPQKELEETNNKIQKFFDSFSQNKESDLA